METDKNQIELKQDAQQEPSETALPEEIVFTREEFEKVREHMEALKKENAATIALAQRVQADFENYRKRNANISCDSMDEGVRETIKALLPVIDNFERAMQSPCADVAWLEGIGLVYRQMLDALTRQGLAEIDTSGAFDPQLHEAVMQEAAEGKQSGTILETLQKGYMVKDRIIRHSMVKVAK
ncbi:MAG: nucleotide exchange factor GrpE [Bacillota bacterium]